MNTNLQLANNHWLGFGGVRGWVMECSLGYKTNRLNRWVNFFVGGPNLRPTPAQVAGRLVETA